MYNVIWILDKYFLKYEGQIDSMATCSILLFFTNMDSNITEFSVGLIKQWYQWTNHGQNIWKNVEKLKRMIS